MESEKVQGKSLRLLVGVATIFIILMLGYIDLKTATQFRLNFFYLIPIILAAYYLGNRFGLLTSLLASICYRLPDYFSYDMIVWPLIWNFLMNFGVFYTVSLFTTKFKAKQESKLAFIKEKNEYLEKSLREKEILIREIHHRVKNNLNLLITLINLQHPAINPDEAFKTLESRIYSMAALYNKLCYSEDASGVVNLKNYFSDLIESIFDVYKNAANIKVNIHGDEVYISASKANSLGLIVTELITNSIKYGFLGKAEGQIEITYHKEFNDLYLKVADNGIGFDYKPNQIKENKIGMFLVESLVEQLGGNTTFCNEQGAIFSICFKDIVEEGRKDTALEDERVAVV